MLTFYGLPGHLWHTNTSTLTQTRKLWPKDYCHMPFSWALGRNWRQELIKQAGRQWAQQSRWLAVITCCALGQS